MTIFPRNLILGLVVLALGVAVVVGKQGGSVEQRQVLPLMPGFDATAIEGVTIERDLITASGTGGETLRVTLVRGPGGWRVQELSGAGARPREVDGLLARIGEMNDQDVLTEDPGRLAQYGFGDGRATRILLDGGVGFDGRIEVARGDGPGDPAFVRVGGSSRVVRVPRFRIPSARPRAWLDRSPLVAFSQLDIKEMRFSGTALGEPLVATAPGGTLGEFTGGNGERLDRTLVRRLVDEELRLVPLGVRGSRSGTPGDPVLRIEIDPRAGDPVTWDVLSLGDPAADPPVPATVVKGTGVAGEVVLELAPSSVRSLVELLTRIADGSR